MPLWRPNVYSELELAPVWAALARYHYGVEHYRPARGGPWMIEVVRLVRQPDCFVKVPVCRHEHENEIDVIRLALPHLPGIGVRIAVLAALMEVG